MDELGQVQNETYLNSSSPSVYPTDLVGQAGAGGTRGSRGQAHCLIPKANGIMGRAMIQACTSIDQPGWLDFRAALWPHDLETHRREMAALLARPERYGQFVAYGPDGTPLGFAEAAVRTDYVNGTESSPVAFLEGIFVHPTGRRQGVARGLVRTVEAWAHSHGCGELASDALLHNEASHAMHRALGFDETERVVYFRKLTSPEPSVSARTASATAGTTVREVTPEDATAIAGLYNHYILHSIATFEEEPIDGAEMSRRMDAVAEASLPWLVAESSSGMAGYAYACRWKGRRGYRFTAEISVYLGPDDTGRGIGTALYTRLFDELAARQMRCIIGGIGLPNDASVALHEKFGMRKVAHFERNGIKFGRWIDVGYWQRLLPE